MVIVLKRVMATNVRTGGYLIGGTMVRIRLMILESLEEKSHGAFVHHVDVSVYIYIYMIYI
jgi:hypothetical protein